jgi:hypothetical protein
MFVLVREDGKYVAPGGQKKSYTSNLDDARAFRSREDAERNACGNERAVAVSDIAGRG